MPDANTDDPLLAIACQSVVMSIEHGARKRRARGHPRGHSSTTPVASNIEDDETDEALDHLLTTGLVLEVDDDCFVLFRLDGSPRQSQPTDYIHCTASPNMGLIRSVFWGSVAWFSATAMMVHPEMALGLAIVVAFLSESTHHGAEFRRMQRDGRELSRSTALSANGQVENLERALTRRHIELNNAIEESQRRDAVGSPAARELLNGRKKP